MTSEVTNYIINAIVIIGVYLNTLQLLICFSIVSNDKSDIEELDKELL